jgi:hypothetical protein
MSESARHFLDIYRTRLRMAEKGTIRPKTEVVAGMRQLVAGLSSLEPDTKITLGIQPSWTLFKVAATGELVAKIKFNDKDEQA